MTMLLDTYREAVRAVFKLHKPQEITLPDGSWGQNCEHCDGVVYPCKTIDVARKALQNFTGVSHGLR